MSSLNRLPGLMKPKKFQYLSYVPFKIELFFEHTKLSTGTAFFYLLEGKRYLVTNWHNITGRHPADFAPISPTGGLPNRMVLGLPAVEPVSAGVVNLRWDNHALPIYEDSE